VPSNCIFDLTTCTCTWTDGGLPNTPDAPADRGDVRMTGLLCGNGVLDPGEQCDDGNRVNGDGCNAFCQIEARWDCPTPGEPCIPCGTDGAGGCDGGPVGYCGDGIIQTYLGEECDMGELNGALVDDNGNPTDGGGWVYCSASCLLPPMHMDEAAAQRPSTYPPPGMHDPGSRGRQQFVGR
jgi:cysteine-rich repeat protein